VKCPSCTHNQKAKDGLICQKCGYQYVFNPKSDNLSTNGPKLTDGKMIALLRLASANDTTYFTRNQLRLHIERQVWRNKIISIIIGGIVTTFILVIGMIIFFSNKRETTAAYLIISISLIVLFFLFRSLWKGPPYMDDDTLHGLLERWQAAGHKLPLFIDQPRLLHPPTEGGFPDIYDYGVERLLIVQHDELVDLFVLNQWHTQNKTLVFSENGYPHYLRPQVDQLLREHPALPIAILHDASPEGDTMKDRVRRLSWLDTRNHRILDLGLFHEDISKIKRLFHRKPHLDTPVDALPYPMLASGVGAAVLGGIPLSMLLEKPEDFGPMDFG
jgi:hypothetical protein